MGYFLQLVVSGLSVGCIYALVALGFVVIYKASKIINMAQGELVMIGAYIALFFLVDIKWNIGIALLMTLLCMVMLGYLLNRIVMQRFLEESVLSSIMVTIGIASFLRGLSGIVFGLRETRIPSLFGDGTIKIGSASLYELELWTILIATILIVAITIFFRYSKIGLAMRASAENKEVAQAMGISVTSILMISWLIAALVAGIGGIFYSQINYVTPSIYLVGLKALPAIFLGGIDSIKGSIVGGVSIGLIESFAGGFIGGDIKEIAAFIVLFIVLMVKPHGLYGTVEVKRV
ncbi:branched-chain amino acid ABC transporter permease [Neobacillus niacini]|uniref:branched-chain amino acid ABC transporter permease n=1 Tax=Neobacillus niacini TaxID=86668 RepID=UPI002FFFF0CE